MKAWRLTFSGQYPTHQEDVLAETVVDAIAVCEKLFHKQRVSINTKKELIDVKCLSDDIVVEEDDYSFGFRFYDKVITKINGETLRGKAKNHSNWYYWGKEYDKEDVHEKFGKDSTCARNMEYNNIERVVETKFGQMRELEKGDIVL